MLRRPAHFVLLCAFLGGGVRISGQQSQVERVRQLDLNRDVREVQTARVGPVAPTFSQTDGGDDLESFGIQQMLVSGPARMRNFRVFGEMSAFATNNVGLSRRDPSSDSFFVGNFGIEYRRPLKRRGFEVDATFQVAMFRYNQFRQLNFNSFDVGTGITYHSEKLKGVDFAARYNFNALTGVSSGDAFFESHTITLGAEKVFQFGSTRYAVLGLSGRISFAAPRSNERQEISAYAGYHFEPTSRMDVDLGYRYGRFLYTDGGRKDHNQTISLGLRYRLTDWFSASASSFYVWDRSNQDVFSYNAGTVGGALMFMMRF